MNILFLGDVVGKAGCQAVMRHLRSLKKLYAIDACIINGENSAEGNGITPESAQMLFDAGADVITTGNHVLKRREIYPLLEEEKGRADVLSEEQEQQTQDDEDEDEPKRFLGAAGRDGAVTVKTVVEDQVIEHEVINRETSLLAPGKTKLVQSGSDGKKTVTYEQRMVGREIRKKKVIDEQIHQQPVTEITLTGVEGKAVSPLDFGIKLDENGVPTEYSKLLTNQVAAGYNVEGGARGASGQGLSAGYVAVHPGEIPYGTKMYITSADNSFVYGFAVAADTGVGLMNDVIDVDLYYDTFLESCLNGKRNVNIYILD